MLFIGEIKPPHQTNFNETNLDNRETFQFKGPFRILMCLLEYILINCFIFSCFSFELRFNHRYSFTSSHDPGHSSWCNCCNVHADKEAESTPG